MKNTPKDNIIKRDMILMEHHNEDMDHIPCVGTKLTQANLGTSKNLIIKLWTGNLSPKMK